MARSGWPDLLRRVLGFEVVAIGKSGEEAVALVAEHTPDICLIDLRLPDLAGPELIEVLLREVPGMHVVILTSHGEPAEILACFAAGASGYLSKETGAEALRDSLHVVAAGKRVFDFGDALRPLLATVVAGARATTASVALTPREVDVLRGVAEGLSNAEISERLGIAERTVKNILGGAMRKLRAPNRTAAAMFARDEDLI